MLSRIAWYFVLLVALVLSLKTLREPDVWWMLRTGEWILENKSVPKQDVFSFTYEGTPWVNVKWLFEVIITMLKNIGGAEFILILQAGIILSILTILRKLYYLLEPIQDNKETTNVGLILSSLLVLLAVDFRMIGRPEMISHLFTVVYIYIFVRYARQNGGKFIYALIPLQCLWANLHEAFGIGMVLLGTFIVGLWLDYLLLKKQEENTFAFTLKGSLVALISILAVVIHPYGFQMLLHPYEIYGQLQTNKFTTELLGFTASDYWKKEAYLNITFLVFSLIAIFSIHKLFAQKTEGSASFAFASAGGGGVVGFLITGFYDWRNFIIRHFSASFILIYGLLFYLSLTAYRNIPFFIFISSILVIAFIQLVATKYIYKYLSPKLTHIVGIVLAGSLYLSIITGIYHKHYNTQDRYGLQLIAGNHPVGASKFIQDNQIKGKCFSDYLLSSYLLWKLQPEFKTFIDLRDLDIFPQEAFSTFAEMVFIPPVFEKKDSLYQFDYVVLFYQEFGNLNTHLCNSPNYDLVFADPVASIFLRKKPQFEQLIAKYGFNANGRKDMFSKIEPTQCSNIAYGVSKLFNPLFQVEDYSKIDQDYLAGVFFNVMGEYTLAQARAVKTLNNGIEKWRGNELLGNIYNNQAGKATDSTSQMNLLVQAISEYDKALQQNAYALESLVGKGIAYMQQGRHAEAIPFFKRAVNVSPNSFTANKYLAFCFKIQYYNHNPSAHNLDNWLKHTQTMNRLNPDNPYIILDLGLAYCAKKDCQKAVEELTKVLKFPDLPPQELMMAQDCYKKCGGK